MCAKRGGTATQLGAVSAGASLQGERRNHAGPKKTRKMSFASDKLFNGYVRRNMPTIVTKVKVREIMVHLPCLTAHDRETIEAKREMCGNYDAMRLLLDCLKRRDNWPEQFIQALEACEHMGIAAEMREEYNVLRGVRDSAPGSPSQTVVTAHVHPAPPAAHASDQEARATSGGSAAAGSGGAAIADPPEVSRSPSVQPPQATPPEAAEPPAPRTPSPSPETPPPQASASPPPQTEADAHQEPEENSESESQEVCGDGDSQPTDTPPLVSTSLTNSDVTDGSFFTLTPEKMPVQDSNPPNSKITPSSIQMEAANADDIVDGGLALCNDASLFLSKPGPLLSVQPQNNAGSTLHMPDSPFVAPFSGNSGRLEISDSIAQPCQENGVTLNSNEPEENHYESPFESIVVNEGHIAEEPSMQNLDGQSSPWPAQNANGDAGKEVEAVALSSAAVTAPQQDPKLKRSLSTKAVYISVAAGVATCAVLVGLRFMK